MAKKKTEEPKSYQAAMDELETIVQAVENEELDVDQLSEKVKHALNLISYCKHRLKNTEDTLNQAFGEE